MIPKPKPEQARSHIEQFRSSPPGTSAQGHVVKYRPSPIAWLERRGVRLTPVGQDRFRCACPVHGGSPGSMGINKVDGVWLASCFACHFAGDALSLVMAVASISFPAALKELDCRAPSEGAPVLLHKRPCTVVACDVPGCGATISSESRHFKVPGKMGAVWEMSSETAALFQAELAGWWIGCDGERAICAEHIA